ncbi:hypothetical protein [Jatrophihabitans endophyticus]|uniref:hypothetical protein n=1 Tax=Jatrophihabitans endophyticus TaxID=1206085 RepID=UPI0019FD113B|nr:hypothetical protein [Jatrophihabitans endophyticus]MBE7187309.1 hypothetical protein [Jatrophihabitans endophyticus]
MSRRALRWAVGCAVLGAVMLALGIHDAVSFRAPRTDGNQILTLGQMVDLITASGLLIIAALIVIGQVRTHRRLTRHRRWVEQHPLG